MARKKGAALKKAERFEMAGEGLWYIFLAKAGSAAGQLVNALPPTIPRVLLFVLGGFAGLILLLAGIAELYGLYVARDSHIGFHDAFWTELIGVAALVFIGYMMVVSRVIRALWAQAAIIILAGLWSLCIIYCFSAAVQDLLTQKGDHTWAKRADYLRWVYGLGFVFNLAVTVISCIPALREGLLLSTIGVLRGVFSTVLSVCTALVCFQASRSLRK